MATIKRRVVQHGNSTLIISLPSKWTKRHNIKKGAELEVTESTNTITITPQYAEKLENIEMDVTPFGSMIPRLIHALYKRGADELKLDYNDQETFNLIKSALGEEAIGFEILETGRNYCVIKNVSEGTKEFDHVLRQTFLMLLSMAEEGYEAIRHGNIDHIENLISLERTNNRFTTVCRRYLNTKGASEFERIGPLYFMVEEMEKIADEYKYMYSHLSSLKKEKFVIDNNLLEAFNSVNQMLRKVYNIYYKFESEKVSEIKEQRDSIVANLYSVSSKISKQQDIIVYQHTMTLLTYTFSLLGAYLIFGINTRPKG